MVDSFLANECTRIMVDLSITFNTRKNVPPFLFKISQYIIHKTIVYDVG